MLEHSYYSCLRGCHFCSAGQLISPDSPLPAECCLALACLSQQDKGRSCGRRHVLLQTWCASFSAFTDVHVTHVMCQNAPHTVLYFKLEDWKVTPCRREQTLGPDTATDVNTIIWNYSNAWRYKSTDFYVPWHRCNMQEVSWVQTVMVWSEMWSHLLFGKIYLQASKYTTGH